MKATNYPHRFVQSFWTINRSMLEHGFGWLNPECHLMSWVLSAHSLRANADELVLYTDSEGARILVDTLHLPYTDVVVCYDELNCPPVHWAIPKMLTYAKQERPFVHVDADLYLPSGLTEKNWNAPLLTQNQESGTPYYKKMMNFVLNQKPAFPAYLHEELAKESIGSYNAGVMGGTDIDFIQKYCEEAFKVIHDNGWMQRDCRTANVNQNLLFEQLLFYALVEKEGKKVSTLTDKIMGDNQYTFDATCNFFRYDSAPFIHLLGSYKRNVYVCNLMQKTLLLRYPEAYEQILRIFSGKYPRLAPDGQNREIPKMNFAHCIAHYETFVNRCLQEWDSIPAEKLMAAERASAESMFAFNSFLNEDKQATIRRMPDTEIYCYPKEFPKEGFEMLSAKTAKYRYNQYSDIAIRPTFKDKGYEEHLINDLQYNLLTILNTPVTFDELLIKIAPCVQNIINTNNTVEGIIKKELQQLVAKELIVIEKNITNQ